MQLEIAAAPSTSPLLTATHLLHLLPNGRVKSTSTFSPGAAAPRLSPSPSPCLPCPHRIQKGFITVLRLLQLDECLSGPVGTRGSCAGASGIREDAWFALCWPGREGEQQELWTHRRAQTEIQGSQTAGMSGVRILHPGHIHGWIVGDIVGVSTGRDGLGALHSRWVLSVLHLCSSISNASLNSRLLTDSLYSCRTPGKPGRGMGISRVKGKEGKALFVFNLPDKSERF